MSHIKPSLFKELHENLVDAFDELRQDIITGLINSVNTSHRLAAERLQQVPSDELVDMLSKLEVLTLSHKISRLKMIDAALNNIQMDMYGLCSDCESEIEITRLKQDPTQQRCSECEGKYEKQRYNHYKL